MSIQTNAHLPHFATRVLALLFFTIASGCQSEPTVTAPPALEEGTQSVVVSNFRFVLPESFERVEIDSEKPENLAIEIYRDNATENPRPTVVNASVSTDELAVENAIASPRESVVHFNVGLANAAGVKIEEREESKQLKINGLQLLGFYWTGTTPDGIAAHGLTFGGVDGNRTISFGTMEFCEATQEKRATMMKYLTSLSKADP